MWEATDSPGSLHHFQDQQSDSKSDILEQVNAYAEEDINILEEVDHYQSEESEQQEEENLRPH